MLLLLMLMLMMMMLSMMTNFTIRVSAAIFIIIIIAFDSGARNHIVVVLADEDVKIKSRGVPRTCADDAKHKNEVSDLTAVVNGGEQHREGGEENMREHVDRLLHQLVS